MPAPGTQRYHQVLENKQTAGELESYLEHRRVTNKECVTVIHIGGISEPDITVTPQI